MTAHREPTTAEPAGGDRHRATVAAEVRRLETSLWSLGPMHQVTLAHIVRAERWREGTFEEALRMGVRQGRLERLPFGFIKAVKR